MKPTKGKIPTDRLTRVCNSMIDTLENHYESLDTDKCMIFLDDGDRGGIVLHGYKDDMEAMVDLLVHLTAIFKANGKTLMLVPVANDG